jgi:hypothetical protein
MNMTNLLKLFCAASFVAWTGCGREAGSTPEVLATSETETSFNKAFAKAAPDLKGAADELATALSSSNFPAAYAQVTVLLARPDLTPEQRELLARSHVTVMQNLQQKAQAGDAESAQMLKLHRSSK